MRQFLPATALCILKSCFRLYVLIAGVALSSQAQESGSDLFETWIRPVLSAECYECHGAGSQKADLRLDYRDGLLKGGHSGPVLDFDSPSKSLLVQVMRHEIEDVEMPKDGARLSEDIISRFETWIAKGAPDPRATMPSANASAQSGDASSDTWQAALEFRSQWWCFQPVQSVSPPQLTGNNDWAWTSIDRFLMDSWRKAGIQPADDAPPSHIVRRLTYTLTGLPPSADEVRAFEQDFIQSPQRAIEKKIDGLLASKHFGERWARHWMDWMRYADSHGSEGDPQIPYAWQYRDYLIRAINEDVPIDQLIRENLAGDLLAEPRINPDSDLNESAIGPAQYRMVLHGFAPTDALDELVRFTENQIDVTFKAFQGLTVACARCHNHKFDPISQEDFYGLYGVMATTRPASVGIDSPEKALRGIRELQAIKNEIKSELVSQWLAQLEPMRSNPQSWIDKLDASPDAANDPNHPLFIWKKFRSIGFENQDRLASEWSGIRDSALNDPNQDRAGGNDSKPGEDQYPAWHFDGSPDAGDGWFADGNTLTHSPSPNGAFAIALEGDNAVTGIYPAGFYSHLISTRHRGVLESPRFSVPDGNLYMRITGDGNAAFRYVIQNYPRNGTVYPVSNINKSETWRWIGFNLDYWNGDEAHIELATAADQPVLARVGQERSWFGVSDVVVLPNGSKAPENQPHEFTRPLVAAIDARPEIIRSPESVASSYLSSIESAVRSWGRSDMSADQSRFLDSVIRAGILSNSLKSSDKLSKLVSSYRSIENSQVPIPTRAPGVHEGTPLTQALMVRGNHRQLAQPVPRKFLDVFGAQKFNAMNSGRLDLAEAILADGNPLTTRVMVNRLWHHVFGSGIVPTVDNFGRLGEKPTHPELLDFLANRLKANDWSLKSTLREILMSRVFHLSGSVSDHVMNLDPSNRLLSHFPVRRLDAEAIRDGILVAGNSLDKSMYGPPAGSQSGRRSIYIPVIRNRLDEFLTTFDFPAPISTLGRRNTTNVPAQSLQMMNSPFVLEVASTLSTLALEKSSTSAGPDIPSAIGYLFQSTLGRLPTEKERSLAEDFLKEASNISDELQKQIRHSKEELDRLTTRRTSLIDQGTSLVRKSRETRDSTAMTAADADPVIHWDFRKSPGSDLKGLKLIGETRISPEGLVLENGFAQSSPLNFGNSTVTEKTLMVRLKLHNASQQGGGAITIENESGALFDSIVLGERQQGHWIAGSNFFHRTSDVNGPPENQDSIADPIHMSVTWANDGTVSLFRNGKPYGQPYKAQTPPAFESGKTHLLLGLRHLPDSQQKRLKATIIEAALFDRVLSSDTIAALAQEDPDWVSESAAADALNPGDQRRLADIESAISEIRSGLNELESRAALAPDPLRDLAQSLLNTKEFIYLF